MCPKTMIAKVGIKLFDRRCILKNHGCKGWHMCIYNSKRWLGKLTWSFESFDRVCTFKNHGCEGWRNCMDNSERTICVQKQWLQRLTWSFESFYSISTFKNHGCEGWVSFIDYLLITRLNPHYKLGCSVSSPETWILILSKLAVKPWLLKHTGQRLLFWLLLTNRRAHPHKRIQ